MIKFIYLFLLLGSVLIGSTPTNAKPTQKEKCTQVIKQYHFLYALKVVCFMRWNSRIEEAVKECGQVINKEESRKINAKGLDEGFAYVNSKQNLNCQEEFEKFSEYMVY